MASLAGPLLVSPAGADGTIGTNPRPACGRMVEVGQNGSQELGGGHGGRDATVNGAGWGEPGVAGQASRGPSACAGSHLVVAGRLLATAAFLAAVAVSGCDLRLLTGGDYTCVPDNPRSCPAGWYCQMRVAAPGEYRCYAQPGSYCGDGVRDAWEACDGADFGNESCESQGFAQGILTCSPSCDTASVDGCSGGCGNGVREGREECDGEDLGDRTCTDLGWYEATGLTCGSDCKLDDWACGGGRCGDGGKNGPEECDGEDVAGATCPDFGFYRGGVGCTAQCRLDISGCTGECGDGVIDAADGEECDEESFGSDYPSFRSFTFGARCARTP
jgi:hypothetical protein